MILHIFLKKEKLGATEMRKGRRILEMKLNPYQQGKIKIEIVN